MLKRAGVSLNGSGLAREQTAGAVRSGSRSRLPELGQEGAEVRDHGLVDLVPDVGLTVEDGRPRALEHVAPPPRHRNRHGLV